MPDNLRNRNEGGYYVSLVAVKSPEAFDELKFLTKLPWLRKLLLRLVNVAKMVFDAVSKIYPNKITEDVSFRVNIYFLFLKKKKMCVFIMFMKFLILFKNLLPFINEIGNY